MIRRKLDIPMNILVTAPVKRALQRVAVENMISVSDIVRAAINAAVPVQFESYSTYLSEEIEKDNFEIVHKAFNPAYKAIDERK